MKEKPDRYLNESRIYLFDNKVIRQLEKSYVIKFDGDLPNAPNEDVTASISDPKKEAEDHHKEVQRLLAFYK